MKSTVYTCSNFFCKNVDLTEKNVDFAVKIVILFLTIFPHCALWIKRNLHNLSFDWLNIIDFRQYFVKLVLWNEILSSKVSFTKVLLQKSKSSSLCIPQKKKLISRNFCQMVVKVKFHDFHAVLSLKSFVLKVFYLSP